MYLQDFEVRRCHWEITEENWISWEGSNQLFWWSQQFIQPDSEQKPGSETPPKSRNGHDQKEYSRSQEWDQFCWREPFQGGVFHKEVGKTFGSNRKKIKYPFELKYNYVLKTKITV